MNCNKQYGADDHAYDICFLDLSFTLFRVFAPGNVFYCFPVVFSHLDISVYY